MRRETVKAGRCRDAGMIPPYERVQTIIPQRFFWVSNPEAVAIAPGRLRKSAKGCFGLAGSKKTGKAAEFDIESIQKIC